MPSPINPPPACRFHTRCWKAQDICRTQEPPLLQITSGPAATTAGHTVACHFPVEPGEFAAKAEAARAPGPGRIVRLSGAVGTLARRGPTDANHPGTRGWMDDDLTDEERSDQVRSVLLKALGVLVVIGVLIFLGTTIMVHALDLNESDSAGAVGGSSPTSPSPLPTTALPVPGEKTETPSDDAVLERRPQRRKQGDIELRISPVMARPMERVNFTGTYKGADNVQLEVQRFDNGKWSNFGVAGDRQVGTFATYIMTGRTGENRFRVFDPEAKKGSNVILVTID